MKHNNKPTRKDESHINRNGWVCAFKAISKQYCFIAEKANPNYKFI